MKGDRIDYWISTSVVVEMVVARSTNASGGYIALPKNVAKYV